MPQGVFDSNVDFSSAVTATGTNGANGIVATSDTGTGVSASSSTGTGVVGSGPVGVSGSSHSTTGIGVIGFGATGIRGNSHSGAGVHGQSTDGTGIIAQSTNGIGLHAVGGGASPTTLPFPRTAIFAESGNNPAIHAICSGAEICIRGTSNSGVGVVGSSPFGTGISGNGGQFGVRGRSDGVNGVAVQGTSDQGFAGRFFGNVDIQGTLSKKAGGFKIDHPLDPENKYLSHSFVESPDMLNIYNGNITTNANGYATILLPDFFEALNEGFCYQLTVVGQFARAIVAEEVRNNQFTIQTDQPNTRVSWQVTGVRKDHFANMHRIRIEENKPANERGIYPTRKRTANPT
jgi:hypothetical protein